MKLYSGPLSLFTSKVRIALAEKALRYERIEVGWSLADRYLPHHPDVVTLNPNHTVPVLVDGEATVYDSTVILEYLEDRYPSPGLYPTGAADRALCRQLEHAADERIFPHVWDVVEEGLYPPDEGGRNPERLQAAKAGLALEYAELDKRLGSNAHLCGDFTVADIATYVMLSAAGSLGIAAEAGFVNLQGWLQRVGERKSIAQEMRSMQGFLAKALAAETRNDG